MMAAGATRTTRELPQRSIFAYTATITTGKEQSMPKKLSDDEVTSALANLSGWSRQGDAIERTFSFQRFADGIAFVDRVAALADAANHHPDIDIRYTKIKISLSTHDAGGITQADVDLANQITGAA
jgi:4a-hydroxytetrahydrobiopterin dehydratase